MSWVLHHGEIDEAKAAIEKAAAAVARFESEIVKTAKDAEKLAAVFYEIGFDLRILAMPPEERIEQREKRAAKAKEFWFNKM